LLLDDDKSERRAKNEWKKRGEIAGKIRQKSV
jgi:hypothetical protein